MMFNKKWMITKLNTTDSILTFYCHGFIKLNIICARLIS